MKKIVLFVFFIMVCAASPLKAEPVIMDDYVDYHLKELITIYDGYEIYGLEMVVIDTGDVSYGLLAFNPSLLSSFPFMIVGFEDEKYLSFTIQGYWTGSGTVGVLSTNTKSGTAKVTLTIGEQRR